VNKKGIAMTDRRETRVVSAKMLEFHIDPKTEDSTLEFALDNGHQLYVVLSREGLRSLFQKIVHERDEGRAAFLLPKENR
jgi:hypothetical protein